MAAALASAIGNRVRRERQSRRWTLDQLADSAGVSRRMLVNVEQGTANPSIGILLKLSDALGVGLPALVEPPVRASIQITKNGDGAVLWQSPTGGRAVLVAGTTPPNVVELWDWTLGAGDHYRSTPHTPGTTELIHLHHGAITVEVADDSVHLSPGDAVTFRGDLPHAYINTSPTPANFSLTVFEPGVGHQLRSESEHA
ncbi:helix-turn-helix transcriptional regulator [Rhodococcus fascians]|nr:helix-turn-helix transcriptional regulator [Rhodococcus fascians]MBY4114651.1 helix-turn-helix transcriptional regulator [Rhodococcus fascians]